MATCQRIHWERIGDAASVAAAIRDYVPDEATVRDVQRFAEEQGIEHSELIDGTIYCSAPAATDLEWTIAKWLMEFHFRDGRLVDLCVDKGLIGP